MITSLFHSLIKKPVLIPFNGTDIPLSVNLSSCVFRFSVIFAGTGYLTMLRKIPLLLFAIILLGSCSDKDLEPLQEEYNRNRERPINTASRLPLMLKADAKEGNIYDMFMFEIADSTYTGPNGSIALFFQYMDRLDSLIWQVEGEPGSFQLLRKGEGSSGMTSKWSHYFYRPGTHTAYLRGYKDRELVAADTVKINVTNTRDFLTLTWNDIPENHKDHDVYPNFNTKDYYLRIFPRRRGNLVYATLDARMEDVVFGEGHTQQQADQTAEILYTYITDLYGLPAYAESGPAIEQVYHDHFRLPAGDNEVLKIWFTPTSHIALMKKENYFKNGFEYEIHAEPNYQ